MLLEIFEPQQPLRAFVKSIIYYQGYTARSNYEQLLPDGHSQLIIELDDNKRILKGETAQQSNSFTHSWISGVQTSPLLYRAEQNATTLSIQFEAGGLFALSQVPATEYQNEMVEGTAVLDTTIDILREQLMACTNPAQIFQTTRQFLLKNLLKANNERQLLAYVLHHLKNEDLPLATISQNTGYSQKQLIHIFKKHVGLSPKKYQRLHRFNRALSILSGQSQLQFDHIAQQCNYYDQSHFINEFRQFSGYSPTQYLAFQRDYPHVIPLHSER